MVGVCANPNRFTMGSERANGVWGANAREYSCLPVLNNRHGHEQYVQKLLLTPKQKFRFGLTWPGKAKVELLILYEVKRGFAQAALSPCSMDTSTLLDIKTR